MSQYDTTWDVRVGKETFLYTKGKVKQFLCECVCVSVQNK